MGESGDLPARMAIPLAFLHTCRREVIAGATRFQKLVFLAQEESDLPREYDYKPDRFGPFSPQLHSDISTLVEDGYVEETHETNAVGHTRHEFKLTDSGYRVAREFAAKDTTGRIFGSAEEVKREWGETRIRLLIQYVYNKYEKYTTSSELDLDRLFDPDAESQFLDSEGAEEGDDFAGPGPGEWQDLNPSADELFSTE